MEVCYWALLFMPLVILHHLLNIFVQLANKRGFTKKNDRSDCGERWIKRYRTWLVFGRCWVPISAWVCIYYSEGYPLWFCSALTGDVTSSAESGVNRCVSTIKLLNLNFTTNWEICFETG
jgi:hypothetical protein